MEDDASKVDKNISDETKVTDTVTVVKEKTDNEATVVKEEPAIVTVHATAVIENSTSESLMQIECKNLKGLVFRERHLQENIVKLEFGHQATQDLRNGKYNQTLGLRLYVSTRKIRERPRSYVWKHLGQNEWSKGSSSTVVFNWIHVKM